MDLNIIQIILVLIIAFMAGCGSVLDQFQTHQPIIACTLIGLVTGQPIPGIILGGTLQLIALGWMNIGAAVAPDAGLASVAAAILVCAKGIGGLQTTAEITASVAQAIAIAIPMSVAGLALTILIRTINSGTAHLVDAVAARGNSRAVEGLSLAALALQGLRIAIPAACILALPNEMVKAALDAIPAWVTTGLSAAGGFIVVVGYAMVMNMMASKKVWPFFFLGFALASLTELGLIAMGIIGLCLALIYLDLSPEFNGGGGGSVTANAGASAGADPLDDILNDYE